MTPDEQLLKEINHWLPKIPGWCSPAKAALMVKVIREYKPQLCIEIGTFAGSSLIPQALALKLNGSGIIYGIDPWRKEDALEEMIGEEHKAWWGKVDLDDMMAHCQHFIRHLGVGAQVHLLRDKAENVVDQFKDGSVDLLHIDGNHSEALAYRDATLWLPKVRPGGHIFFDDIFWAEGKPGEAPKPTTRKAVMFLLEHCTRLDLIKDCMLMRKK
jgi:predicted O-methyltransferase YrrM